MYVLYHWATMYNLITSLTFALESVIKVINDSFNNIWVVTKCDGILGPLITLLMHLAVSLQPRALPVLSHPNRPSWPVLIPRPGASWVPRPTMPTQSPHVQQEWVAWQGHLPRTQFQTTGMIERGNEESFLFSAAVLVKSCLLSHVDAEKQSLAVWTTVCNQFYVFYSFVETK